MIITAEDIKQVQEILRRWRTAAIGKGNKEAKADVEHVMKVINQLYTGGARC